MRYAGAYAEQCRHLDEVIAARAGGEGRSDPGRLLLVEHEPVITISRRAGAAGHLVATPEVLAREGVEVVETDRGGDITYHGPGQLVVYPILDLNALNLGLHEYMRLLEDAVIGACGRFGVTARRDAAGTGVWVDGARGPGAKVAAMGVRVRRWVSMHGLALNVRPNLDHFSLIVPCGLHGRTVTSLHEVLGSECPSMNDAKRVVVEELGTRIAGAREKAARARRTPDSAKAPG